MASHSSAAYGHTSPASHRRASASAVKHGSPPDAPAPPPLPSTSNVSNLKNGAQLYGKYRITLYFMFYIPVRANHTIFVIPTMFLLCLWCVCEIK